MNVVEIVEEIIIFKELNDAIKFGNIFISYFFINLMNKFNLILSEILNFWLFFLTFWIDFLSKDIEVGLRNSLEILKYFIFIMSPFKDFSFIFFVI